jgi:hypothetical protein
LLKTQANEKETVMIGYCPGYDHPITGEQPTRLVLGQLYHAAQAPHAEKGR